MQAHPVFAGILAGIEAQPEQLARARYITALKSHDWSREWSDDGEKYMRGRQQRKELEAMRVQLDPDYTVWNQHCPERYRDGMAATC